MEQPWHIDYGQPLNGWTLVKGIQDGPYIQAGEWGLFHKSFPGKLITWKTDPMRDQIQDMYDNLIAKGMTPDEVESAIDQSGNEITTEFIEKANEFTSELRCEPLIGHALIQACVIAGYELLIPGTSFGYWLFHKLAKHIEEYTLC